ncbi:MerR family transcriptional regulator [Aneurinibacillus sp. Ricciae_BoGa-3]|uniref:MerR family transcriptional regulator n=1 Tax=Aneurinibacillus sp. Ricciae_BoGa-3 TaxID=3022697 RepID=UPI003FA42755
MAEAVGVTVDTVRHWEKEGKIKSERTSGGHRRYNLGHVLSYVNGLDMVVKLFLKCVEFTVWRLSF